MCGARCHVGTHRRLATTWTFMALDSDNKLTVSYGLAPQAPGAEARRAAEPPRIPAGPEGGAEQSASGPVSQVKY